MPVSISSAFPYDDPAEPVWTSLVPRVLDAYIANPSDMYRRVDYALMWQHVALMQPEFTANSRPPIGYSWRPDGAAQSAHLAARAIAELDRLIDDGITGPALYQARAELRIGWVQWELAAADLRAALATTPATAEGDEWRRQLTAQLSAVEAAYVPDLKRKQRQELEATAERVAGHAVNLLPPQSPSQDRLFGPDQIQVQLDPRAAVIAEQARALGFRFLHWSEDQAVVGKLGHRALSGTWVDAEGASVLLVEAVRENPVLSLDTRLSDGTLLGTVASKRSPMFEGGPQLDRLYVDVGDSLADLQRLHGQRLRILFFDRPGVVPYFTADSAAVLDMLAQERGAKRAFRIAEGMSEMEARGVPVQRPDILVPLMRAAARRQVMATVATQRSAA